MGVSNPRDDRSLGFAQHGHHPEGWKRPSTIEPYIGFFFLHNTTEKLKRIYVVCLGKNRVRTEFLSQGKTTDFLIMCAKKKKKKKKKNANSHGFPEKLEYFA